MRYDEANNVVVVEINYATDNTIDVIKELAKQSLLGRKLLIETDLPISGFERKIGVECAHIYGHTQIINDLILTKEDEEFYRYLGGIIMDYMLPSGYGVMARGKLYVVEVENE